MTEIQKRIRAFNTLVAEKKGLTPPPDQPIVPDAAARRLRVSLIADELVEFCEALSVNLLIADGKVFVTGGEGPYNEVEAYDAALDLDYVVTGSADSFGQDMEPGQAECHRSNMSKFEDGSVGPHGRWNKGPKYSPVDLQPILDAMRK